MKPVNHGRPVKPEIQAISIAKRKVTKASKASDDFTIAERTERAQHLFRMRSNLANGSVDSLNLARAYVTFDPHRRYAHYIDRFAASIDPGAKSGNSSRGGREERLAILRDIDHELEKLSIPYEDAFATNAFR